MIRPDHCSLRALDGDLSSAQAAVLAALGPVKGHPRAGTWCSWAHVGWGVGGVIAGGLACYLVLNQRARLVQLQ